MKTPQIKKITQDANILNESQMIDEALALPLGRLLAENLVIPESVDMATWPSACTIKGVPACDDF